MTSPIPPSKEAVEAATASILIWLDCNEMLGIDDDIHAVLAALSSAESENTRLSRVFSQNLDLQMEVADLRTRLEIAERERDEDNRLRSRMFSLLLAIKHDAEWHDHQSRTPRVQFSAYHAEADALLSELISPSVSEAASKMMAQMALNATSTDREVGNG